MSSRTTILLDDDLLLRLKERAKNEDAPLEQLINEAVRSWLLMPTKESKREPFVQKTYDMGQPLIDITHTNAVIDALEDEEIIRKMRLASEGH